MNQPTTQEDLTKGTITFVQHYLPPLEAGDYCIQVEQEVKGSRDGNENVINEQFTIDKRFTVRGERFTLNPAEVYALFPPLHSLGEYSNCLPHIVFTRRTLPWERTLEGKHQCPKMQDGGDNSDNSDVAPWLALLLFEEDEINQFKKDQQGKTLKQITVNDLIKNNLPDNTCSYPLLTNENSLDYGEHKSDKCFVIDVPVNLFLEIAPTSEDIKYLAHTRDVCIKCAEKKEVPHNAKVKRDSDDSNAVHKFSVIVGNRLPRQGVKSTVHLVSLEGLKDYLPLPKDDDTCKPEDDDTCKDELNSKKYIRLLSLKSWDFTAKKETESFKGLVKNLDVGTLQFPPLKNDGSVDAIQTAIQATLKEGYIAMNHHLQEGDKTVSWYRGPLVPSAVKKTIPTHVNSQEQLMRCHAGMLDVSYAAAWQLGRLLALQNKHFAVALCNWKREINQKTILLLEKSIIQSKLSQSLTSKKLTEIELTKEGLKLISQTLKDTHIAKKQG